MIDFELHLDGNGWADAILTEASKKHIYTASWLHDGLREFLECLCKLFSAREAQCEWLQEPGLLRWTLERADAQLLIRAEYPRNEAEGQNEHYKLYENNFSSQTDLLNFLEQVITAYSSVLEKWGAGRYEDHRGWGYPFPFQELQKLTDLAATL
ncbi:MAG: hypothetical protein M3R04_01590 [bacterium]|nr:hypothetical protein [bacterium]